MRLPLASGANKACLDSRRSLTLERFEPTTRVLRGAIFTNQRVFLVERIDKYTIYIYIHTNNALSIYTVFVVYVNIFSDLHVGSGEELQTPEVQQRQVKNKQQS